MNEKWVDEVLDFWFKELTYEDWFGGDKALDETITTRFKPLYQEKRSNFRVETVEDARTALAAIILFDQFPRNMFRGTAEAFATDHLALQIATEVVEREYDHDLTDEQKAFAYMPFMHSEDLKDQTRSLGLFTALGAERNIKIAREHRDIIAEYGRFPHRNEVLGRETRTEEQAAITQGSNW